MPLHIYKIQAYEHRAETEQFDAVARILAARTDDHDNLLVGNYHVNGVELDALLITAHGVTMLEFKTGGGHVTVRENGSWTADGQVIIDGTLGINPCARVKKYRNKVTTELGEYLHKDLRHRVKACIVFSRKAEFENLLPPAITSWLTVCDMEHFGEAVTETDGGEAVFTNEELLQIPQRLHIGEFRAENGSGTIYDAPDRPITYKAEEFYAMLEQTVAADLPIRQKYSALAALFRRIVEQGVAESPLHFAGSIILKLGAIASFLGLIVGGGAIVIGGLNDENWNRLAIGLSVLMLGFFVTAVLVQHIAHRDGNADYTHLTVWRSIQGGLFFTFLVSFFVFLALGIYFWVMYDLWALGVGSIAAFVFMLFLAIEISIRFSMHEATKVKKDRDATKADGTITSFSPISPIFVFGKTFPLLYKCTVEVYGVTTLTFIRRRRWRKLHIRKNSPVTVLFTPSKPRFCYFEDIRRRS